MSIDRGDSHWESARTWERACRHIGLYLAWAIERGLASDNFDAKAAAKNPTQYFITMCDTKLWDDDFNEEGLGFTNAQYTAYLKEVSRYAKQQGVGDYDIPENAATTKHFYAFLDDKLAKLRTPAKAKKATPSPSKAKTKSKPKSKAKTKSKSKAKSKPKTKPKAKSKKSK